ncbi:hypothetical protein Q5752_004803 [Cryptotrichosporon argae]
MAAYAASLVPRIRAILESSDLASISAKGVRRKLVEGGEDEARIKHARADIDAHTNEIYEELAAGASSDTSSELVTKPDAKPDTRPRSNPSASSASASTGSASASVPRVQLDADERLARSLQADYDQLLSARGRRAAAPAPKKKKAGTAGAGVKRKSKAVVGSDGEEVEDKPRKRGGGGGAFNKEMLLSDPLAELVTEPRLSRPQTVKRIWDYVKANGLQDATDKRFILCDDKLRAVFKTDKLHMFTMNKILSQHLRNPDEIAP